MTYLRHRCLVAFAILLLTLICLQTSGVLAVQRPDGHPGRNIPSCHCCHGKLYLKYGGRFDLKLVFLLPSRLICLGDPAIRPAVIHSLFLCSLSARTCAAASWRGPPHLPTLS